MNFRSLMKLMRLCEKGFLCIFFKLQIKMNKVNMETKIIEIIFHLLPYLPLHRPVLRLREHVVPIPRAATNKPKYPILNNFLLH